MSTYDRNTRLQMIAQSRQATQRLAKLVVDPHCKIAEIEYCLAIGALIEDAHTQNKDPRAEQNTIKTPGIVPVLKHDRADIAMALFKAGGLDCEEFKNWTALAIESNAINCLTAFIQGGLTQYDAPDIASCMTMAALKESPIYVEKLLMAGVSSNIEIIDDTYLPTLYKSRPLHWARHKDVAKALLDAGAKINARNQHGKPPVGTLLERLKMHAGTKEKDIKEHQALMETICHLISKGCLLELEGKEGQWHAWSIWTSMDHHNVDYTPIVQTLIERDDVNIKKQAGKIQSIALFEAILDTHPDESADIWLSPRAWAGVSLGGNGQMERIEKLLDLGVKPPKLFEVNERYQNEWICVGIPITEADLDKVEQHAYDEEIRWHRPSEEQVAQSNAKALARIAKRAQTQAVRPSGRTAPKF